MRIKSILVTFLLFVLTAGVGYANDFTPNTPSQEVDCNIVDNTIAKYPHGNGDGVITDDELGPGGWRFSSSGGSFVTFEFSLNSEEDGYDSNAGRSNVSGNAGIINDYPAFLDLPQGESPGVLVFNGPQGQIQLSGGNGFALPGQENGSVNINVSDTDGDGAYEGCAKSPFITNFGFLVSEGGSFVEQDLFKVYAMTDADGVVVFWEFTEISTFKRAK